MSDIPSESRAAGAVDASMTGTAEAPRETAASSCGAGREVDIDDGKQARGSRNLRQQIHRHAQSDSG